eukprot:6641254-Prymnesium_polylepis.1
MPRLWAKAESGVWAAQAVGKGRVWVVGTVSEPWGGLHSLWRTHTSSQGYETQMMRRPSSYASSAMISRRLIGCGDSAAITLYWSEG